MEKSLKNLQTKYRVTAYLYDFLDAPWERIYRHWRPQLTAGLTGKGIEAGVGTGRNLPYYTKSCQLLGIDLSPQMISLAEKRKQDSMTLRVADATHLYFIPDQSLDFYLSTFMYCVLPDQLQEKAISEMVRVLKKGSPFRILEIVTSKNPKIAFRQKIFAPFVRWVYGAGFDRHTLTIIKNNPYLSITKTSFLKDDTYLLIEGIRN